MTDIATPDLDTRASSLPTDLGAAIDMVRAGLVALAECEPWRLSDEQVVAAFGELLAMRGVTEAVASRMFAAVGDRDLPRLAGASSPRAWLMALHGLSGVDASRLVREAAVHPHPTGLDGRDGRTQPTVQAWFGGELNAEQAVLIAGTASRLDPRIADDDVHALQVDLAVHAQTLTYQQLAHVCRHAAEVVDPDGADKRLAEQLEAEEARALAQTTLSFRPAGLGVVAFSGKLPAVQADMWRTHLEAFTAPRHRVGGGWAALPESADDRILDHIESQGNDISYGQRLGRAHCELLEHLPSDGLPQHGVANATIVLTMDHAALVQGVGEATLDTGTPVSPGQIRRLACNAQLIPAVLDGPSRVLDLGIAQRLFDRTQRIALCLRDKGCVFPGCDRVPAWCEAHHLRPWSAGGPTDLRNGCLLCPFHHHLIHATGEQAGWKIRMSTDGVPEVLPPPRVDPQRRPRRHDRFSARHARPPTC